MLASDESFPSRDIVEESKRMKVRSSCDWFSVSLEYVFLLLKESEVRAHGIENISLFEFTFFVGDAVSVHND